MNIINYISIIAVPFTIFYIVSYGFMEKVKVFDSFIIGAKEGISTVFKIFPTLIALFLAISALRNSGILDFMQNIFSPFLNALNVPIEIFPLMLIRPISGSASTAVALDIMKNCGVDTLIGLIASTIMGSTETTLYTIAIYTSAIKIKKIRFVLYVALIADVVRNACFRILLSNNVDLFFLTFITYRCIIKLSFIIQHFLSYI